jgi:transcriptional regulator with XRE-family HTH domain
MQTDERLKELADFLKTRRAKLQPGQVGLPHGRRRRIPGLRREEVAELAGISVTWYTWLEQARKVSVSARTALKIADALRLNESERQHFFKLIEQPHALDTITPRDDLDPLFQSLLDGLAERPAYVLSHRWDVLAWNEAADAIFQFSTCIRETLAPPNLIGIVFTSQRYKTLSVNWESDARDMLAHFRSDYGENVKSDRTLEYMVKSLSRTNPDFKQWWLHHDVIQRSGWPKEFLVPDLGLLRLRTIMLEKTREQFPRIVIYIPDLESAAFIKLWLAGNESKV